MACMEHSCIDCGHVWFNNRRESRCPMCVSHSVTNLWDEEPDSEDDYYEEEEDE